MNTKNYRSAIPILLLFLISVSAYAQGPGFRGAQKSEGEALRLAVTNTLMPIAVGIGAAHLFDGGVLEKSGVLAIYGIVVGPSTGNFYASDYARGGIGMLARLGGAYLMKDAAREVLGDEVIDPLGFDEEEAELGDAKVLIGSGLILVSTVYNIITAPKSVREYNAAFGYGVKVQALKGTGTSVPMLTVSYRF